MNWSAVRLRDVATVITKGTTPTTIGFDFVENGIPFLRAEDISGSAVDISLTAKRIAKDCHGAMGRSQLHPGDLLITIAGTVGRVGIVPADTTEANCNQAISITRLKPGLFDPQFLIYAVQSPVVQAQIRKQGTTATITNISLAQIGDLEIPLPTLEDQRYIVDILSRAERIVRLRRQAQRKAAEIIPALFLDMFGDPATNPKSFATAQLAEFADVVSGITKGRKLNGKASRPIPYLRVANVQAGFLNLSDIKLIDASESEIESLALQPGDIVLTEGGDFDKLGRGAQWRGQLSTCIHQNHVFRVRLKVGVAEPDYFEAFLQTVAAKTYFLSVAKRTTNLASINMTQLKNLPVILPPIDAQRQFSERMMFAHSIIGLQATGLARAQATFTAMLARVFSEDKALDRECGVLQETALAQKG